MKPYFSICFTFLLALLLTKASFAQNANLSEDQRALLREALKAAVSEPKTLPNYDLLPDKKEIVLFDKMVSLDDAAKAPVYLTKHDVLKIPKVKILLQTETEIFKERPQDLLFLRVMQINQPESDYAVVTVMAQYALGTESKQRGFLYKQTEGVTMLFKKTGGEWKYDKTITSLQNLLDYK